MGQVDGRGMAIGIAGGVVVGLVIMLVTGSAFWIGVDAAIGALIGMHIKFGSDDK